MIPTNKQNLHYLYIKQYYFSIKHINDSLND